MIRAWLIGALVLFNRGAFGSVGREPLSDFVEKARTIVDFPLFTVSNSPVTVRSVLIGVIFFILGVVFSKILTKIFARRILSKIGLAQGVLKSLESLTFYILIISFTLFALRASHIPLTAFTVIGGALALGVGFGSQNVINNFMSGLILMLERPIKIGDYIEVESQVGTVEHIGIRSTQILSPDNTHLILPNSAFLEKAVRNWTLVNQVVRTEVQVGVQYGSPVEKVRDLLLEVARKHMRVLPRPEPLVMFDAFGDSSLNFELLVWVSAESILSRRTIRSQLRYMITAAFEENNIVIAFPQRDIHVENTRPIEVKVIS